MRAEPYIPPPGSPPLREVFRGIVEGQKKLDQLDRDIGDRLATLEDMVRARFDAGRPVDIPFPPWGKLAWSGRRGRGWRFVVLEDDECTDLSQMPALCWTDACHVLPKLLKRMGLVKEAA